LLSQAAVGFGAPAPEAGPGQLRSAREQAQAIVQASDTHV
jgi:hypothetical protein